MLAFNRLHSKIMHLKEAKQRITTKAKRKKEEKNRKIKKEETRDQLMTTNRRLMTIPDCGIVTCRDITKNNLMRKGVKRLVCLWHRLEKIVMSD